MTNKQPNTHHLPQPSEVACDLSDFAPLTNAALRAHIAKLQADGDKLADALARISTLRPAGDVATAKNTRQLVQQMETIALSALTEWKDRA